MFIYLTAQGLSWSMGIFNCGMWDVVPQPEMEPRPLDHQ